MDSQNKPNAASLNEYQARRLRVTSQYIDKILGGVEDILNFAASKAAFPRYVEDVAPAQRRTIENYIARIRAQLVRVLDGQGISRDKPFIPASRAIHVALGTIDIAVEELKPQYMRGYGDLPEAAATELNGIVGELYGLVSKLDHYLAEGVGQDLTLRLQRLEKKNNDLELLSRIEDVVARRGVVEFRTAVASILGRAEDKTFEIALFGRVSSGKSSLLNAIFGADVLPVGVTPITAVPTRIAYGENPSMRVCFAEAPKKTMEVAQLAEFATEQQNPGNAKRVTRIQKLRASSLQRTTGALRESVISALQVQIRRSETSARGTQDQIRATEARLRHATGLIEKTKAEWESDLERNAFDASHGLAAAFASLMDEWERNLSTESSTEKIVGESILQVVRQRVKKLHDSLEALALRLRDDLKKSASGLGMADAPGEDEFQSLVRGTPMFDPGSVIASVARSRFSSMLGRRFAEKQLAERLHSELGEALNKTLSTYSDVLREWTRRVTNQLLRRFETYAEGYRAQAERSLGGKNISPEEAHGVREDIELRAVREPEHIEPNSQAQKDCEGVFTFSGEVVRHAQGGESD